MSRICDFCDISESSQKCKVMIEVRASERDLKDTHDSHICLDCAKLAVAQMEDHLASQPTVPISERK